MNVEDPNGVQGFALGDDSGIDWNFDYTNKPVVFGVAVPVPITTTNKIRNTCHCTMSAQKLIIPLC
jgi:hypothetical protein